MKERVGDADDEARGEGKEWKIENREECCMATRWKERQHRQGHIKRELHREVVVGWSDHKNKNRHCTGKGKGEQGNH